MCICMYMFVFCTHMSVLWGIAMCSRSQREFHISVNKREIPDMVCQQAFIPDQSEHMIMVQSQQ